MRIPLRRLVLPLLLLAPLVPFARADDEGPSVQSVHAAIQAGADWLRSTYDGEFRTGTWHEPVELVVLTLSHAGVPLDDPVLAKGLATIETVPLQFTYRVSVLAMALERINAPKYRKRLAHCAQWLVDTQLPGGEWGYPGAIRGPDSQPRPVTVARPERPEGESAQAPIEIERKVDVSLYGDAKGDFSNTQFAVLGLRACRDAGIRIPRATWKAAYDYMRKTQRKDGGWGYHYLGAQDDASYASLTAAGVAGAAICLHALKKRPASDSVVKKAKAWLEEHFDATRNVGIERSAILGPSSWETYHLYSVERVGSILGWKTIGETAWYPAGARHLLATQRADGRWVAGAAAETFGKRPLYLTTADTCFALLFLAKATPPLTGGR